MEILLFYTLCIVLSYIAYPAWIKYLNRTHQQQVVSEYSLEAFKQKQKTPSLGGVIFVFVPLFLLVLLRFEWLRIPAIQMIVFAYTIYALIGLVDDLKIIREGKNNGLKARDKFLFQCIVALGFYGLFRHALDTSVYIPLIRVSVDLGWLYVPFILFLFAGVSNAVNITDGMDGLAGGTAAIALAGFAFFAVRQGQYEVYYFVIAVLGSLLAYLNFNRFPAKIIMGDVGSLALGALLAVLAIVLKIEVLLAFIGAVFVWETACVIIQIGSVKLFKRRVFRYTPIHYSFTLGGWSEKKVVLFFYGLSLLALLTGILIGVYG